MGSLGNRTFLGTDLHPDVIRRLDDLIQQITTNASDIAAAKALVPTTAQITAIAKSVTKTTVQAPGTVLNITNATGSAANPQPAAIPIVGSLPTSGQVGQAFQFQGNIWIWNGSAFVKAVTTGVQVVGSANATGQSASIGATNILTSPPAGIYRLTAYVATSTAGSGNVTVNFDFTDSVGAKTLTSGSIALTSSNSGQWTAMFQVASGAIQYATTYASTGAYNIYLILEQLA